MGWISLWGRASIESDSGSITIWGGASIDAGGVWGAASCADATANKSVATVSASAAEDERGMPKVFSGKSPKSNKELVTSSKRVDSLPKLIVEGGREQGPSKFSG